MSAMSVWLVFIAGMSAGIALERAIPPPPDGWAWWAMGLHAAFGLALAWALARKSSRLKRT